MTIRGKAAAATVGVIAALAATGTVAASASPYEWNDGARGSGPSGRHPFDCVGTTGGIACFQQYGDLFWVKDTRRDKRAAMAVWRTQDTRNGVCRNAHGAGTWAVCDKNLGEHDPLELWAARYTTSRGITDWSAKLFSATT
jgi:hypothetical protein